MKSHILAGTAVLLIVTAAYYSSSLPRQTTQLTIQPEPAPQQSLAPTDNEIIQHVFEGLFAENNLEGPYMIKYCFDAPTSHKIVVFVTDLLAKAAKASVTDLVKLISEIKDFATAIPEGTVDCLGRQQEIYELGFKYNIDGSTDFQALQIHTATYVTLHFLEVHRWAVDLNSKWTASKYNDFGFAAGGYGHKLLDYP